MKEKLEAILKSEFGYPTFKTGQKETIESLLAGKDTLAILPTGTGKSLCYQFIGKYLKRSVLIVSPLISLMQDQVEQLRYSGEKAVVALNSQLSFAEKRFVLQNIASFQYIYVSPEMLGSAEVLNALGQLELGLFVIDEAHCILQWGPDFRPEYLNLGKIRKKLHEPLTLALTATATPRVAQDITASLGLAQTGNVIRYPVDRPNIYLGTQSFINEPEKLAYLLELLPKLNGKGIIYFSSKKKADEINENLVTKGFKSAVYHADLELTERFLVQQQFLNDQLDVICATSAFGMGINKPNIRYVIHYHMPNDLEAYVQEIGRCSRDGKTGIAVLLYEPGDLKRQEFLIEKTLPNPQQIRYFTKHQELLQNFPSEEMQLLARLLANGYQKDQIETLVKKRQTERNVALQKMHQYLKTGNCKRQFIAQYFGDKVENIHGSGTCCGTGQALPLEKLGLLGEPAVKVSEINELDYREILQQLFKET
ncbi:RecQ family ATP-dependent DNA helicase [Ligilactobacillus animalis]|uniref:ATP-dependent DNA helicase RecQ n=1 Tax=Ligilactobacillus animalis TaxID=1605 RepID=A0ABR4RPP4_9LACO|nr:ATP-dependent DNA helicase RecQ [Ligilactobacillus animalis]KDA46049.1 ATP-dependent DNA helicase RecQ, recQ [Ligilactobacillus animalis]MEE0261633.1 ATP-dependent DNA helicase RecQ [Ligilactobacillus animalis]PNQ53010.1 ATP-dependent DNA helicase RecQ [Ligilactobacillus animalis]